MGRRGARGNGGAPEKQLQCLSETKVGDICNKLNDTSLDPWVFALMESDVVHLHDSDAWSDIILDVGCGKMNCVLQLIEFYVSSAFAQILRIKRAKIAGPAYLKRKRKDLCFFTFLSDWLS